MAEQSHSLYRKYRPQTLDELRGQEHVSGALRNALKDDRVAHAYLFSGPRGTGKTTTARILAKALNCLDLTPRGDACGACVNCVAVAEQNFADLHELDAASNNGVDAMRDLVEKVHYGLSATGKRKVYVVDEVHMLSPGAGNALLKTLEEPPEHVVFILATTDPQKVLPTIRSRTQHFEFGLLSDAELRDYVAWIAEQEQITVDAAVIDLVVRQGRGSARDALSKLDMAFAIGLDAGSHELDAPRVLAALGDTPFDRRFAVLRAIADDNPAGALLAVHDALRSGVDPRTLADEILVTARDAFVLSATNGKASFGGTAAESSQLQELVHGMGLGRCTRVIETLGDAVADMRGAGTPDPRLALEVAVVRLARHETTSDVSGLLERIASLEAKVQQLASSGSVAATSTPSAPSGPRPSLGAFKQQRSAPSAPEPTPASPPNTGANSGPITGPSPTAAPAPAPTAAPAPPTRSGPVELDDVVVAWSATLASLNSATRAMVAQAQPVSVDRDANGDIAVFGVPRDQFVAVRDRFKAKADEIRTELARQLGTTVRFKLEEHDFAAPGALGGPQHDLPDEVDLDEIVDAADAPPPPDTQALLAQEFGATVVEEKPRDQ